MLYIFGSPRSGTTLLAQCLNANSQIIIPHETHMMILLAFVIDQVRDPAVGRLLIKEIIAHSSSFRDSLGEFLSEDELQDIIQGTEYEFDDLINGIYGYIGRKNHVKIVGDKSPNDLMYLRIISQVGGLAKDSKIVHIVRDVRDVMISLNDQPWGKGMDSFFPRIWNSSNLYLYSIMSGNDADYLLVKYESFCSEPRKTIEQVCNFLQVDFENKVLDSSNFHHRYKSMSHQKRIWMPIGSDRIGIYKRSGLTAATLALYERQAAEGLEVFGYNV